MDKDKVIASMLKALEFYADPGTYEDELKPRVTAHVAAALFSGVVIQKKPITEHGAKARECIRRYRKKLNDSN